MGKYDKQAQVVGLHQVFHCLALPIGVPEKHTVVLLVFLFGFVLKKNTIK